MSKTDVFTVNVTQKHQVLELFSRYRDLEFRNNLNLDILNRLFTYLLF